jgi:hypothetical protein
MAIIKNWGYGEDSDFMVNGEWKRIYARFVGITNKHKFANTILKYRCSVGRKWILDRMSETSNDFELDLINKNPNKVICYDDKTKEIIKFLGIN